MQAPTLKNLQGTWERSLAADGEDDRDEAREKGMCVHFDEDDFDLCCWSSSVESVAGIVEEEEDDNLIIDEKWCSSHPRQCQKSIFVVRHSACTRRATFSRLSFFLFFQSDATTKRHCWPLHRRYSLRHRSRIRLERGAHPSTLIAPPISPHPSGSCHGGSRAPDTHPLTTRSHHRTAHRRCRQTQCPPHLSRTPDRRIRTGGATLARFPLSAPIHSPLLSQTDAPSSLARTSP